MVDKKEIADICILAEGSYPYYFGGVAQWTHELITEHKDWTFHVLTLMPPHPDLTVRYKFPSNVIGHTTHIVQSLPNGASARKTPKETWNILHHTLKGLITSKTFSDFGPFLSFCQQHEKILGKKILSESPGAWEFIVKLYHEVLPSGPFKDYFSTIFVLNRCLLSLSLLPLPSARLYHALCTGYAGFLLYRAKYETKAPCMITEHGVYTNERRIEIAFAKWISDISSMNLSIEDRHNNLKEYWLNVFLSFSHACYTSCDEVLTTFDGNQDIQLEGGADPKKMQVIVHGINPDEFPPIVRDRKSRPPTIAFVGRIVPVKDVKTFIRACQIIKRSLPETRIYVLGPTEEDRVYFKECQNLVAELGMEEAISFFGRVNFREYLPEIDLVVFTSLTEVQPLVVLEAGSSGLPFVATNVGACSQLCYGQSDEKPPLGQGGIVTPLANPEETAAAVIRMLTDEPFYQQCCTTMQKRVSTYYRHDHEYETYKKLYNKYLT